MSHKITVPIPLPNGSTEKKVGLLMDIVEQKEFWSEYTLEDGTIIRVKQAIAQIVKIDTPNPDDDPQYIVQAQPIIIIIPK